MVYLQKRIKTPQSKANLEKIAKSKLMNRLESYQSIISQKKGIKEIPYQMEFLVKNEEFNKPFVLAGGTSSGKTITTAIWIEMFYQNPLNKGKRTLLIPASTTVLRDNMGDTFDIFNPNFNYCVCRTKEDLKSSIESDCDVILCLPQTLVGSISELKHFHNFILDEAHQWYFKKTISNIIEKIKPKNQLLLTGTPSKFVAKGKKFDFAFVPVMDLYKLGLVSNVGIKVVSSTYNPSQLDYSSTYGSLGDSYKLKESDNIKSLKMVCKEMITKLGSNCIKLSSSNPYSVLGEIDKTIIFCHSQKQANQFHKILNKTKGLVDNVLVSHTEVDRNSVLFSQFKSDVTKKVLIAVNRGKLGFSMGELFNVIDFTLTQNIDMLLQMYGRVLRLSKHNPTKPKIYYKVATKDTAEYFVNLMKGMLCLTDMEWYSKYNGKNMGGMIIPNVVNDKATPKQSTIKSKSKSVKPYISIEELGIPLDLAFLKKITSNTNTDKFATIAECTLDEVRKEFFGIRTVYTIEEVKEAIRKCSTLKEFSNSYRGSLQWCNRNNRRDLYQHLYKANKPYTIEEVKEAIRKCSTYSEFTKSYIGSFQWCHRNNRKDLYQHLEGFQSVKKAYTIEEIIENIEKCSTFSEFANSYIGSLLWCNRNNRKDLYQHLDRVKKTYTIEEVKEDILKCTTLKEFTKSYRGSFQWCNRNKRTDLFQHLDRVFKPSYTIEEVIENIEKCSTVKEFRINYKGSFQWCNANKRTDLYQHLERVNKTYTIEDVKEDILKCTTLKEFTKGYYGSFRWCNRNNKTDLYQHLGK
jgi:superfamily II DNA or RNA helicase